mmetsp:Transcript_26624/g.82347  ORF Transcript_26624/g.82347 Transcript_26624/m.82347 type:complete len:208 (-) Transcript_26624:68-691(-)
MEAVLLQPADVGLTFLPLRLFESLQRLQASLHRLLIAALRQVGFDVLPPLHSVDHLHFAQPSRQSFAVAQLHKSQHLGLVALLDEIVGRVRVRLAIVLPVHRLARHLTGCAVSDSPVVDCWARPVSRLHRQRPPRNRIEGARAFGRQNAASGFRLKHLASRLQCTMDRRAVRREGEWGLCLGATLHAGDHWTLEEFESIAATNLDRH